ncbi:TlpA family protein disulfide reductase [Zunongwangia sp. HRR-M8]|uniref:TlpA family protein disulfide reductase n=1 Tax=Zunongwangia sp. HRR-M8 TaxID=3015170 RepID=UPI0022DDD428|nr:TlpA disulfide reductase family protein [Zunongwangia sp. HRR-M8]WBL21477.1 TlpA disulfide reductase family protein [Zunongwangia sp. HRR-M8]
MRKIRILLGILLVQFTINAQQTEQIFSLSPKLPNPGDRVTLNYNPANTVLKDAKEIQAVIYINADHKWSASDLNFQETEDNHWKASYKLPENTALISCVFKSDTLVDRGGATTYSWLLDKEPGSYASWGILRSKILQEESIAIVNDSAYISSEVGLMWINKEIEKFPESRNLYFYEGLKLMQYSKEGDHSNRIQNEIKHVLEQDLSKLQQYKLQQSLQLLDKEKSKSFIDSVNDVLLKRYPKGVLARDNEIKRLFTESDVQKKIGEFEEFQSDFPKEDFKEVFTFTEDLYYDKLYRTIAYRYITENGDYSFVFDNLKDAGFYNLVDYSWHFVSIPYNNESIAVDSLNTIASKITPELEIREKVIPKRYEGKLSPQEWKQKAQEASAREYLTYAKILDELKDYKAEDHYLEKIKSFYIYENTDFNELYADYLIRQNNKEEAINFIKESLSRNNATAQMLSILKEDFLAKNRSNANFEEYISGIKSGDSQDQFKEELIAEIINKPIEDFELESSLGGTVKLSDQKGKIVIIDMWATWCAPCKKAMPGMKMAVDKYAEDKNVKFYFLDTQEYISDYKKKTVEFIEENNYPFEILYDAENPESGKFDDTYAKYSKAFEFSGIPQKMIIDQHGKLRWRSTGYSGSPSELADEISIIIEYLKSEK